MSASRPRLVHRWFEARAAVSPGALALDDGSQRLTYEALDERADRVAGTLRARGVRPEDTVGICCEPSANMVVALLAVLKSGGTYVPLDPADPPARLAWILADARITMVVTERALAERFRATGETSCVLVDAESEHDNPWAPPATDRRPPELLERHAMHVLYTSGSTGRPKGVVTSHAAVANRLSWGDETFPFLPDDVACARTSLGFVDSVAEIFAPLVAGRPLIIVDRATRRDLPRLVETLAAARVTRLTVVPSLLSTLLGIHPDLGARLPALRTCFSSGEPIAPALVLAFRRAMPRCSLVNLYGSTEVAGDATFFDLAGVSAACERSPIGRPIRGVRTFVLDGELREVADGEVGEICVSGACLATGYLHEPALTAERFVRHPLAGGDVLYRTGDLGRRLATGDLECGGRADDQVKIRGMRVELAEVEQALAAVPGVARATVLAPSDASGIRSLVAFFSVSDGVDDLEPGVLRAHVARHLPGFMVPSRFIPVEAVPFTASGKVDRALLLALAASPLDTSTGQSTSGSAAERRVARIWEDVLERTAIGRDDSFYDLGGDSLSAARIVMQLGDAFRVRLPVDALFSHPTVASITAFLRASPSTATPSKAVFRDLDAIAPSQSGAIPLSYFQFPFWFFSALTGGVPVVSEVFALSGCATLDVERLQRSYGQTVAEFEALWMRFSRFTPMQSAVPRRPLRFTVCDLRAASSDDAASLLEREVESHMAEPFALARPPLIHARLVRLPGADDRLLVVIPHVVADMRAMDLLGRALESAYRGAAEPAASAPPVEVASLAAVIAWERAVEPEALEADVDYWKGVGHGAAWNSLPARLFRAKLAGRKARALSSRELTSSQEQRLRSYARERRMTLPMALIGAVHASVIAVSGQSTATLLVMLDQRRHEETRSLFANFTSIMKLRVDVAPGDGLDALVERVAAQLRASYAHGDQQMRRPTLFNDFWDAVPDTARSAVAHASALINRCWPDARLPDDIVAQYVFALVPWPRRRVSDARRDILIAVNVLPEVSRVTPTSDASDGRPSCDAGLVVRARRRFSMLIKAEDVMVGTDLLLDTTLQIHFTRTERDRLAVNLYGGAMDQAALDELNDTIVSQLEGLAGVMPGDLHRRVP